MFEYLSLVEQRIIDAQSKGAFDRLSGAGKPLVFDDANVPEDLRMAYKILKNADFLPPELELRKQIHSTRELLNGMGETEEKYKAMKKLNLLISRLNMCRQSNMAFEMPEHYEEKLVARFGKK